MVGLICTRWHIDTCSDKSAAPVSVLVVVGALRSSSSGSTAPEGGYSTLVQMNTVELCLPVIGLLLGPVLIYKEFPSMLN